MSTHESLISVVSHGQSGLVYCQCHTPRQDLSDKWQLQLKVITGRVTPNYYNAQFLLADGGIHRNALKSYGVWDGLDWIRLAVTIIRIFSDHRDNA